MLRHLSLIVLFVYISSCGSTTVTSNRQDVRKFPDGFMFGTSTASYQIEGAWDEDGKSVNIWDHMTHNDPCIIKDCSNGDIADNSYHLYKRDVEMMRELGLNYYRFSLSWTRILPTSFPDKINQAGVDYYDNLINEMLKYNIEPVVTLYHWDLPQKLQELGGWTNPHIVDWFGDYARTVYRLFGDKVKYWITINEPQQVCLYGYGDDSLAPRLNIQGVADYMCVKYLLLAHAKAYHIYDEEFRPSQDGSIFIAFSAQWYEPATENDVMAAWEANEFLWGIYTNPIFAESGDYPTIVKERIAAKSAEQGFPRSRLLEFTPEEVDYVRGSSDIFGLNHYTTLFVYRNESSVPWGFYKLLTKIREIYNNPTVYICENGFATYGGLNDDDRIQNMKTYLSAMLDAIAEGSDIRAYTFWSIMDNFEWMQGYVQRFGLYEVDYEDANRTRTPRKSAFVYKEIIRTHSLDLNFEPTETVMSIDEGK